MASLPTAKSAFANGARRFAERASRRTRAAVLVIAGALVVAMAGPFGTGQLPILPRAGFWLATCLANFALWELWFAWFTRRGWPWRRTLLAGLPAMLLPLPLEVDLGLRAFAGAASGSHIGVWLRGGAIAGLWALTVLLLDRRSAAAPAESRFPGTAIRPGEIAALTAEDHYVRLHLADGSERLLHMRFADAVAAMAGMPGERLGRGAWLADSHRGPAEYRRRRWYIRAGAERWLPVSRGRVSDLRAKGWLARAG